jgi:SPP1 gp7 family putative phage head morphogenesis protein
MAEPDIFAVADRFKRALIAREDAAARKIRRYYRDAEQRIRKRIDRLIDELEQWQREHPGEDPPEWWLFERNRLQALQAQVHTEMAGFAERATRRIEREQWRLVEQAERDAEALARAGLGDPPPGVTVTWARLPKEALEQLVGTLQDGSPLRDLLDALGPAASEQIRRELVSGLALGQNPRDVARRIRDALNGNRVRAETIARTEMLRSYREATRQNYLANSDVVKGWVWHAARDERTCAMCWAMHGSEHTLDEHLDDHPRGRCAMVPLTKTWAELGFEGVPETRAEIETGESLFARLSPEQQRMILGNAGYEAYKAGAVKLSDFVGQKSDPRWGTMRYAWSLREILGASEARKWRAAATAVFGRSGNLSRDVTDQAIRRAIALGRSPAGEELQRIMARVRAAPFDTRELPTPKQLQGLSYLGRSLGERDSALFQHLVKRVLDEGQWAYGTTEADYLAALRMALNYEGAEWYAYRRRGGSVVAVIAPWDRMDVPRRGPMSLPLLCVIYSADRGIIVSGYQCSSLDVVTMGIGVMRWR